MQRWLSQQVRNRIRHLRELQGHRSADRGLQCAGLHRRRAAGHDHAGGRRKIAQRTLRLQIDRGVCNREDHRMGQGRQGSGLHRIRRCRGGHQTRDMGELGIVERGQQTGRVAERTERGNAAVGCAQNGKQLRRIGRKHGNVAGMREKTQPRRRNLCRNVRAGILNIVDDPKAGQIILDGLRRRNGVCRGRRSKQQERTRSGRPGKTRLVSGHRRHGNRAITQRRQIGTGQRYNLRRAGSGQRHDDRVGTMRKGNRNRAAGLGDQRIHTTGCRCLRRIRQLRPTCRRRQDRGRRRKQGKRGGCRAGGRIPGSSGRGRHRNGAVTKHLEVGHSQGNRLRRAVSSQRLGNGMPAIGERNRDRSAIRCLHCDDTSGFNRGRRARAARDAGTQRQHRGGSRDDGSAPRRATRTGATRRTMTPRRSGNAATHGTKAQQHIRRCPDAATRSRRCRARTGIGRQRRSAGRSIAERIECRQCLPKSSQGNIALRQRLARVTRAFDELYVDQVAVGSKLRMDIIANTNGLIRRDFLACGLINHTNMGTLGQLYSITPVFQINFLNLPSRKIFNLKNNTHVKTP